MVSTCNAMGAHGGDSLSLVSKQNAAKAISSVTNNMDRIFKLVSRITSVLSERPLKLADQKTER